MRRINTEEPAIQNQKPSGAVKSVFRAVKILEAFNAEEGMTVTEISKRFNFPKSSVHQILNTLTNENMLAKDLVGCADKALYEAKNQGKNTCCLCQFKKVSTRKSAAVSRKKTKTRPKK